MQLKLRKVKSSSQGHAARRCLCIGLSVPPGLLLSYHLYIMAYCARPVLSNSATTWAVPRQISMGFPRQEYWSGLPFPSPEDLPHSEMGPASLLSLALAGVGFVCLFVCLPADPPGTAVFLPSCQLLCLCSKPIISFQTPGLIKQMLQPHSCASLEPTDTGAHRDRELGRCLVWSPSPSPGPFFALRLPVSPQARLSQPRCQQPLAEVSITFACRIQVDCDMLLLLWLITRALARYTVIMTQKETSLGCVQVFPRAIRKGPGGI